ncbi:hypothetical protein CEUSTIGMA_g10703.t1 [Chlamydomonas eustigma]|uniref:Protein kinase domain-containing protein n=1 Tax=Chlamydomonas eustigma TaxID=1157962 RepID=A0A250XJM6_9CHLO|nr:hypothetical protein CEUSTIGMA_g10703.t1 [Chlamydomonas eustigma]|eukprot:GAX83277.1 hypothetical protein CEUSTIGMA_g10703.t1 [Chlamydomonas eustigma]
MEASTIFDGLSVVLQGAEEKEVKEVADDDSSDYYEVVESGRCQLDVYEDANCGVDISVESVEAVTKGLPSVLRCVAMLEALLHDVVGGMEKVQRMNKLDSSASSKHLLRQTEHQGGGDQLERQLIASTGVGCRRAVAVRRLRSRKRQVVVQNRQMNTAWKGKIQELKEELQTMRVHAHALEMDKAQLQLRVGALEIDASELVPQMTELQVQLHQQKLQAWTWGVQVFNIALSTPLLDLDLSCTPKCTLVEVARGGCGLVFRMQDENHLREDLVLKVPLEVDHGYLLGREAVTMQYAQGPGVVALLGYLKGNIEAGEPLVRGLVMEMMDMGSLQELIGGLLIPLESTVDIMLQAAVGLQSLHDKGLIHMIADFGFAEYVGTTEGFVLGPTSGTPGYMAPECYITAAKVSMKVDVFAFGLTLFHLLYASEASKEPCIPELERLALQTKGSPPTLSPQHIPKYSHLPSCCQEEVTAIGGIIAACISEEVVLRPSMQEVVEELQQIQQRVARRLNRLKDVSAPYVDMLAAGISPELPELLACFYSANLTGLDPPLDSCRKNYLPTSLSM